MVENRPREAQADVDQIRSHTAAARAAADEPIWTLASSIPGVGQNFIAIAELARSADDVAILALDPLVKLMGSFNWDKLLPDGTGTNLEVIDAAAPDVASAAHAIRASADRLANIEAGSLLPEVAEPLVRSRERLKSVSGALDASAHAAEIAPAMMGAQGARDYLLIIQNNAEARASGGIPGALAVLTLDRGKLSMEGQASAGDIGVMSPPIVVESEQQKIYSARLGKFMQDVNLTPDFPTAAKTAQTMWEKKTGHRVDGVISVDPVALGYILDATGPIKITNPEVLALAKSGALPTELSGQNVVRTLLSDVYAKIPSPPIQDAYFAGVAKEIFAELSSGQSEAKRLVEGVTRGMAERRVLVWSAAASEQAVIGKYPLSGSISGSSVPPAQFGIYFNDGTGAKMDYYVRRHVQLIKECSNNGYEQVKVRVTSSNTAPRDAATSLPAYVTGGGGFGVPAGTVQTNIIAYGPVQSNVEAAFVAGKKIGFASHRHGDRPVGSVTVRLAPGQSRTVDFTFDKIVQHTEPELSVTPTVQTLNDVVLDTVSAKCVQTP